MSVGKALSASVVKVEVLQVVFVVEFSDGMPSRFMYNRVAEVCAVYTTIKCGVGTGQCRVPIVPKCNAARFRGVHHHTDNRVLFFKVRNSRSIHHCLVV